MNEPSVWLLMRCLPQKYHPMETDEDVFSSVADYIEFLREKVQIMTERLNEPGQSFSANGAGDNNRFSESMLNHTASDETSKEYWTQEEPIDINFIENLCSSLLEDEEKLKEGPRMVPQPEASSLPNLIVTDLDFMGEAKDSAQSVVATAPKRPGNGFIRFSCKMRPAVISHHPKQDNRYISKIIGQMWCGMNAEQKKYYTDEFDREMARLRVTHPTWNYAGSRAKKRNVPSIDKHPLVLDTRLRDRSVDRSAKSLNLNMEIQAPMKKKRRSSRTSCKRKRVDGKRSEECSPEDETTTWVMCDSCNIWRELDKEVIVNDLPETWYCYMNPDEAHNICYYSDASAGMASNGVMKLENNII